MGATAALIRLTRAAQNRLSARLPGLEGRQIFQKMGRKGMQITSKLRLAGLGLCAALATTGTVLAESETDRLLEVLIRKGVLTQQEAAEIQAEVARPEPEARPEVADVVPGYDPTAPLRDDDVRVQVRRFGVETEDGEHRFRIRGRFQFDTARADFGDGIPDVARQGAEFPEYGAILRRLRLGALGTMYTNWEWQLEADYAENEIDLANAYIAYLMPTGRIAIGHFKEPFGMEYATSSRYITFLERSAASDAYKVNREPGIMYETLRPNWYGAFGVFGGGIDFNRDVEEGWAWSGRLTAAPWLEGNNFIHVGGGINQRRNAFDKSTDSWSPVRLRTREGTRVIDARLIGRDDLEGVRKFTRHNLEFAAGYGPWSMQAEYIWVDIDLDREALDIALGGNATTSNSLTQDGWYVQTTYFLTGESRNYRAFSGDFARVSPFQNFSLSDGTWGAFEAALRYSVADSLEHTRPDRGQKLTHWTAGLNWYLNPDTIFKFNLIYLEGERDVFKDDGWVYAARFQYEF